MIIPYVKEKDGTSASVDIHYPTSNGGWAPLGEDHAILLVVLGQDESWAVDPTAAQYGHKEALMPWSQYKKERVEYIRDDSSPICPPDDIINLIDRPPGVPLPFMNSNQCSDMIKAYRYALETWQAKHSPAAIMKLSAADFQQTKDKFLQYVESGLHETIKKLRRA
jgi:hypothetical protein